MKTLMTLALTLILTAACLVGCGCTNQKMDDPAPTVLPTNEEIWNSSEATTHSTTIPTTIPETTDHTRVTQPTDTTRGINETEVQNHVNAHTDMMDKIKDKEKAPALSETNAAGNGSRMLPGTR